MKTQTTIALAAAVLLSGAAAAAAADVASSHSGMAKPVSDTLSLSSAQQKTAWRDLDRPVFNQFGPPGFIVSEGAVLPRGVTTDAMPKKAAHDIPALRPYAYALVQHDVVIVNPRDRKIAEVISG